MIQLMHLAPAHTHAQVRNQTLDGRAVMVIGEQAEDETFLALLRKVNPSFVMLDYPAFEGEEVPMEKYAEWINKLHPNVITVPDVRFNGAKTLERARQFYEYFFGSDLLPNWPCELLVVPQGKSQAEWYECLDGLMELRPDRVALVEEVEELFLVPNADTTKLDDYAPGRVGALMALEYTRPEVRRTPIHFLGLSEEMEELYFAEYLFPGWVQTCDTAKCVALSNLGIRINPMPGTKQQKYPGRGKRYFQKMMNWDLSRRALLAQNIGVLDAWCKAKEGPLTEVESV